LQAAENPAALHADEKVGDRNHYSSFRTLLILAGDICERGFMSIGRWISVNPDRLLS